MKEKLIMNLEILGEVWAIKLSDEMNDSRLIGNDGYCDDSTREIVLNKLNENDPHSLSDLNSYARRVVRHEIIHAVLSESGLKSESWGRNEEIVDWIANQFPKLYTLFEQAQCTT
jgi:hypothetical protein